MRMNRYFVSALIALSSAAQPSVLAAEVSFSPIPGSRFQTSIESLFEKRWKSVMRQGLDISCGSAALATILYFHFGDQVQEDELIRHIIKQVTKAEVRKRGGFSLLELKKVAGKLGYTVKGYKLTLEQLQKRGGPSIVPITVRRYKHFVVYRGMVGDRVVLADPAFGNTVMPDYEFMNVWSGVGLYFTKHSDEPFPAKLDVVPEDLSVAVPDGAVRSFFERGLINSLASPDEF